MYHRCTSNSIPIAKVVSMHSNAHTKLNIPSSWHNYNLKYRTCLNCQIYTLSMHFFPYNIVDVKQSAYQLHKFLHLCYNMYSNMNI